MNKRTIITAPKDTVPTGDLIAQLIANNEANRTIYSKLESYIDDDPQIDRKKPNDIIAINNFAEYITRINVGYLLGSPVTYSVEDTNENSLKVVTDYYDDQHVSHIDSQIGQDCSMFGRGYEVVYIDEDSNPQSAVLDVYGTIVVYDNTYKHRKIFAINYAPKLDSSGKIIPKNYDVTIWDKASIKQYVLNDKTLTEDTALAQQHFFDRVPVIEYFNNVRLKGDYENVISLIDAYNILQSDRIIDREKLVDAILAVYGAKLSEEDRQAIKDNRVAGLPNGGKIEYIVKELNEGNADVLRKVLASDIHKFSMTPDMSSDEFGGNGSNSTSGVALKYRLLPFEDKAKDKQQYFEDGLRRRLELYITFLATRSKLTAGFDASLVDVNFRRSLPQNDYETSQMIANLDGLVDRETLAEQLSFVKNAREVVQKAEAEDTALGNASFGTNQPTGVADGAPQAN